MYKHVKATNLEGRKKLRKAVTILNVHPSSRKSTHQGTTTVESQFT